MILYLLPGRGRALNQGLGAALIERGYQVDGRALVGDFAKLTYQEQIAIIKQDILRLDPKESKIIAVSYGAYLYLQAQIEVPAFAGSVLLLSPVVGSASNHAFGQSFIPPQHTRIKTCAEQKKFPVPHSLRIYVGSDDWQCPIDEVKIIAEYLGISLNIIKGMGHRLDPAYVKTVLDEWLES